MEKLWALVRLLAHKTDARSLEWKITPRANAFQASFPDHTVTIAELPRQRSTKPDYEITLSDSDGRVIENVRDSELKEMEEGGPHVVYSVMEQLYAGSRRSALGVDKAIDGIFISLAATRDNDAGS